MVNSGNAEGEKGPQLKVSATSSTTAGRLAMRLTPPEKLRSCSRRYAPKRSSRQDIDSTCRTIKVYRIDVLHYAYRPGRSAQGAVGRIETLLRSGHMEVVDADLSGYFDSIPHSELMKSVARRVRDRHLLHLLKMWPTMTC